MIKNFTLVTAAALLLTVTAAKADTAEIYLLNLLDNTQAGYCLDIAGGQGGASRSRQRTSGPYLLQPVGRDFRGSGV